MSEYRYYEFQAIDKPLTEKQMREVRSCSTRASITQTSFVNHYEWGDFKGDEDAWMEKYFDAFLYLANWGTHALKFRLSSRLLDPNTARKYCVGESASVREKSGNLILSFASENEGDDDWIGGEGILSSLISVRAELARGDLRALYLGWLLSAQTEELDDKDFEPIVPPGLCDLTAAQESLVEFLYIDKDLLHVAAQASAPFHDAELNFDEVQAWISKLPTVEKDNALARFVVNGDHAIVADLLQRFLKDRSIGVSQESSPRRTVGELLRAAEVHRNERRQAEAEKRAKEKARQEREAIRKREKYLDGIAGREPKLWTEVEALVDTKLPKNYDQAVKLLVDLRDLDARSKGRDFHERLNALRSLHARKPSFIDRVVKARL